ncbi:hypothetical protein NLI96_g13030 [Meripilus lineatus]|uniref:Uncharacterized protein n=1 Tax=Meripilus lineatus TaxID=2056292 RepID=A0AAD5YBV0_9APHY|nr:hypothetical protein NLI96_g13030 [Physisporinus lineatus]
MSWRALTRLVSRSPPSVPLCTRALSQFRHHQIIHDLGEQCNDGTFFLVNKLAQNHAQPQEIHKILAINQISRIDYEKWLPAATAPSFRHALTRLSEAGVVLKPQSESSALAQRVNGRPVQPPTWLVFHLLQNKVPEPNDMQGLLELVFYHQYAVPPSLRPCLFVLAAYSLVQHGAVAPLRRIVRSFLDSDDAPSEPLFNLLLRTLSQAPQSPELSLLVVTLMQMMRTLEYQVSSETFNDLLRPDFVAIEIAGEVEKDMKNQGVSPTMEQLESLLRLRARKGHSSPALKYLKTIRSQLPGSSNGEGEVSSDVENASTSEIDVHRLTQTVAFYRSSYRNLTKVQSRVPSLAKTETRIGTPRPAPPPTESFLYSLPQPHNHHHAISEWTSTLYVASRDKTVSSATLYDLFEGGIESEFRSDIPTFSYIVAVKGFLRKWDTNRAAEVWKMARERSRFRLNAVSVGIGVAALTLHNEAHEAFRLMEVAFSDSLVKKDKEGLVEVRDSRRMRRPHSTQTKTGVNLHAINQFMISLHRIGRPDVVFEMWENLGVLYRLNPDSYTFNALLKTARFAKKYSSGSIRGTLAELGFSRFLGPTSPASHSSTDGISEDEDTLKTQRKKAAERIAKLLDPTDNETRRIDGLWHNQSAPKVALHIARSMFLHNWPELQHIPPPVYPLRHHPSSPAFSPVSDLFHSLLDHRLRTREMSSEDIAVEKLSKEIMDESMYTYIMPTDVTFRSYIDLLGTEMQHATIPLVLAWMKYLNIRPSSTTLATALVYWAEGEDFGEEEGEEVGE